MRVRWTWVVGLAACALVAAGCAGDTAETVAAAQEMGTTSSVAPTTTSSSDAPSTTSSSAVASGDEFAIEISGSSFEPADVSVSAGTAVTWRNRDGFTHTATSTDGDWNARLSSDDRFTMAFDTPGIYPYVCAIHTFMAGTITVTG